MNMLSKVCVMFGNVYTSAYYIVVFSDFSLPIAMHQLEHRDNYNPLQVHSGLSEAVTSLSLTRKSSLSRTASGAPAGRSGRNFHPPVQAPNVSSFIP